MIRVLLASALIFASTSFAGELDNEGSVTNQGLQGTVIVRIDNRNQSAAILQTEQVLTSEQAAHALAASSDFKSLPAQNVRGELDRDGGASSWYWYRGYNYYNYLYWYGNYYYPCYNYNYSYYSYYYYSSYWRW